MKLEHNKTYRGKKPGRSNGYVNDRTLIYIGVFEVQYDGPMVRLGAHYKRCSKEEFLEWASHDVTNELPGGDYQSWLSYKAKK